MSDKINAILDVVEFMANKAANLGASAEDVEEHNKIVALAQNLLKQSFDENEYNNYVNKFDLFFS